jgi:hypothetical protein
VDCPVVDPSCYVVNVSSSYVCHACLNSCNHLKIFCFSLNLSRFLWWNSILKIYRQGLRLLSKCIFSSSDDESDN